MIGVPQRYFGLAVWAPQPDHETGIRQITGMGERIGADDPDVNFLQSRESSVLECARSPNLRFLKDYA